MAKCLGCGRKGLFLKLDSDYNCPNCQAEKKHKKEMLRLQSEISQLEKKLSDTRTIYDEVYEESKTQAHRQLEADLVNLDRDCTKRRELHALILAEHNCVYDATQKLYCELNNAENRLNKLKPLAKSIQAALADMSVTAAEGFIRTHNIDIVRNLSLEELLPEPELNCLSVKDLAAKYRNVRKQIVSVCDSYEMKYTTKAVIAMYKLMVLAMESEFENIIYKLQFGKLESGVESVKELTAKYYAITTDGNQTIAPSLRRFIVQIEALYLDALHIEYEYYVQRERAREEQRAIREQMRQEAEERKRLEQERKKVEAEETKYQAEIDRITAQMQQAHDSELESLRQRLAEVNALMEKVVEKKEEIVNLQNGKAGTVYIISNIGSFGDHVYKIGMTRRLEPQDRVNELGDASVPFPFDVHSFIFSEDAVALESALHHELNDRRVNKVNLRKEFFNVSIDELQRIVERIDPTAPFKVTALAEQYRQSLSIVQSE